MPQMEKTRQEQKVSETAIRTAHEMKLEVVTIPVSDVERAKDFYTGNGWRLDADFTVGDAFRVVQVTPSGSPSSVHFGTNATSAEPGSAQPSACCDRPVQGARRRLEWSRRCQ